MDMAQADRSLYAKKTNDYLYHIVETDTDRILGTFETRFVATKFFNTVDFNTHHFKLEKINWGGIIGVSTIERLVIPCKAFSSVY